MARTLQADDLFALRFLQGGKFSPDGKQVIYSVSHVDTDKDKEFTTIYLYSVETGEHRALTNGNYNDSKPTWSPDGQQIAFVSKRDAEKPQLYIMPIDGGEPRVLTSLKQGVGGDVIWSPDGNKLAFTAGVDYGDDDPPDLSKDVYRVTRNVYRFDAVGYIDQAVQDIYVVNIHDGKSTRLTNDANMNGGLKWSPDGQKILFTASMLPDSFCGFAPNVCLIDMNGNITTLLTGDEDNLQIAAPTWTPDGQRVILIATPTSAEYPIGTKSDLYVYDIASEKLDNRTAGLAVGVGGSISADMPAMGLRAINLLITNDNQFVYVQVQDGGTVQIYRVALHGEEAWKAIVDGERACFPQDIHDGKLLFASDNMLSPPNLYIANLDGSNEQPITRINDDYLAKISLPTWENLHFKGTDGADVEGWFIKPAEGNAPYPTILYIHGGPHSAYGTRFHFDFQMLAGAGYGVLAINHRASTGYGNDFATMIKGDWGNLDYGDLMAGVDYTIEKGLADSEHLGVCGTSGGGNLTAWIIGNTDRFKAAIPQNPVTNWQSFYGTSDVGVWFSVEELGGHPHEIPEIYVKCSPITYAHNCTTPTLCVQSEHDWRCPAEQSEQLYTVLKANGCVVEMLRQPGGSHGASLVGAINLRREHNNAMLDWFGRYVLENKD